MFTLIDRLEQRGRDGAPTAIAIGIVMLLIALGLAAWAQLTLAEQTKWTLLGYRGGAAVAAGLGIVFSMLGVRLRTGVAYPNPTDVWPSLPSAEFREALFAEPRPLAACSDCRIHLPALYSTGACPRCSSSLCWHHIDTDDDAELVASAVAD